MKTNQTTIWIWISRTVVFLLILFWILMSIDVFTPGISLWEGLLGFFIHSSAAWGMLIALLVGWKYPKIGGFLLILIAFGIGLRYGRSGNPGLILILAGVPLAAGIVHYINPGQKS